ncbi:CoA ester lyase [Mesorhizobium sp. LHD-90]|uniref:HpcH/HpaI aldolase/citrate lyase family protein n=1 Tax=Mesorhizobium sp. LHD-90 TaxID=3071414 RepID=UPI0027DFF75B|nr:CoA ester lyase [Mesorhizobium sp. LHD-90]MDQ6434087.1 CoA ester lyase [Mesorhizobium sp. LHD-90]
MSSPADRPFRSVLYMPATNERALAKAATLACDAVIVDLEDAVAPEQKSEARKHLKDWFAARAAKPAATIIRINALSSEWGAEDLALARKLEPDGILLPKIDTPRDILEAGDALDDETAPETVKLWAMVETPKAVLNLGAIAELGRDPASRLAGLVAGTNDLAKDTGMLMTPDRRYLLPWLMQIVLAARAGGLVALDGVMNEFRDLHDFGRECTDGAAMGFDGKTLIHPAQIEPANKAFSPSEAAVAEARAIVEAFARPENAGKGVISLEGRMVERLHLMQAERLLGRAMRP